MAGSASGAPMGAGAPLAGPVLAWVALTDPRDPDGLGVASFVSRSFDGLQGAEVWLSAQVGCWDCGLGECPTSADDLERIQAERER